LTSSLPLLTWLRSFLARKAAASGVGRLDHAQHLIERVGPVALAGVDAVAGEAGEAALVERVEQDQRLVVAAHLRAVGGAGVVGAGERVEAGERAAGGEVEALGVELGGALEQTDGALGVLGLELGEAGEQALALLTLADGGGVRGGGPGDAADAIEEVEDEGLDRRERAGLGDEHVEDGVGAGGGLGERLVGGAGEGEGPGLVACFTALQGDPRALEQQEVPSSRA
jgi:hypothetical protein